MTKSAMLLRIAADSAKLDQLQAEIDEARAQYTTAEAPGLHMTLNRSQAALEIQRDIIKQIQDAVLQSH